DAATRAAAAAQPASAAAKAANEASRQAANAAADAASAATKAGNAAARALAAAANAAGDAGQADAARNAAVAARNAAGDARTAGEASAWAGRAASQAGLAAKAAASAGANAADAAQAAAEAADYSGVSAEDAARARLAAARAKSAAGEAQRAANATVAIAKQAADAAGEAQRAANEAAAHAEAAAAAAEEAARHAGDAATAANVAQAAAAAAAVDADSAANSAVQAHKVADVARATDKERLDAQQAAEMAAADEASREADLKARTAAWESGKATQFAADTAQLIKDAQAPGTDSKTVLLKGRQAALRLLEAGGPWTKAAAQRALEGDDYAVQAFLTTDLTVARDRDDRTSVMAIAQSPGKLEKRLAAEAASVGTPDQVRAFLATGQYPGKDDDDRVELSQIMATGGPGVKAAAGKALDGTIDDVRAFLTVGQFKAREDDNRVLVTQQLATGGGEVKAAAQAVLSGPADRLVPFLQTGLPKAQQRDAMTAAHVATIASYLATIDGSVAQARQYAAQAAQASATARGAANEAATYANTASQSAQAAQGFANQAAQSAQAAQASAAQAATYAQQAQASAASAASAARSASFSAAMATGYANQASQYAADAKTASDQAQASAAAAAKSRDEAYTAAREAAQLIMAKQQADSAEGKMQHETAVVDDNGRVTYVQTVPRPDTKQEILKDNRGRCNFGDPTLGLNSLGTKSSWYDNAAGVRVCDVNATVKVTGTVDYFLRTCPEPNLSIAACQGKYSTWDTLLLRTEPLNTQYDTVIQITEHDWNTKFSGQALANNALREMLFGDFIKCYNDPGFNASCAWAASNFIPYGTLAKGAKAIVAFRFALETGVGIEDAKLALQATLNGYSDAVTSKLLSAADGVAAFRNTFKDGVGSKEALDALSKTPDIDPALVRQLGDELKSVQYVYETCELNSFPAGTRVLLADGSYRAISEIRTGDRVFTTDPATGVLRPQPVTATYAHTTRRMVDIALADGSTLSTTAGHRFYTEQAGWTLASALRPGDRLRASDNTPQTVAGTTDRTGPAPEAVYDLTVDGPHDFFVRTEGVQAPDLLVHNCLYLLNDEAKDSTLHTIKDHVAGGPYTNASGTVRGTDAVRAQAKAELDGFTGVFTDLATAEEALKQAWVSDGAKQYGTAKRLGKSEFKFTAEVTILDANGSKLTSLGDVYQRGGGGVPTPSSTKVEVRVKIDYTTGPDKHPKGWYVTSIFPLPRRGV
ncbi:polymorphic toxin-type HINT domain-containing protein, partial [Kitasatospora sp. NPDC048722]|uniref:polymorphic toxin-type HINT domain-containing protein n=1 Tax=Kitasatospora sp. NPDC048722 TaxID=3155639 RepID=UPI0033CA3F2C